MENREMDALRQGVVIALARQDAIDGVLSALIATHPDPRALMEYWERLLPGIADRAIESPVQSPLQQEIHQRALGRWSEAIRVFAENAPPKQPR